MFFKKMSMVVLVLILAIFAVGCSKNEQNSTTSSSASSSSSETLEQTPEQPSETVTYTVRFNSNGGTAVADQTVAKNGQAQKPIDPTKRDATTEYKFLGWYVGNTLWNFNIPITSDVTLTAKWQVVEQWSEPLPIK